ncbi:T9SS type A sorting domain-containing protein [candidate division WOR-3 bacterium]|nr:T9SS type A sorting domain-containing protein [candidate division WOR-3 bacterium]
MINKVRFFLCLIIILFHLQLHSEWIHNGVPICIDDSSQSAISLNYDNSRAIIAWQDKRNGNWDIYAQKLDSIGNIQWMQNGVPVCMDSFQQYSPQVSQDTEGNAIIVWEDSRGKVYAQRLNSSGNILWTENGINIGSNLDECHNPKIISDNEGGAIIILEGKFTGQPTNIYGFKIDSTGSFVWGNDGIVVCSDTNNHQNPKIVSDNEGGLIVIWKDSRDTLGNDFIYGQRISSEGIILWTSEGVPVCRSNNDKYNYEIASDGANGAIIAWQDKRDYSWKVYAQRIDSVGNPVWLEDGVKIAKDNVEGFYPELISDGQGNTFVTWLHSGYHIYAQCLDSIGNILWDSGGVRICPYNSYQNYPEIITDSSGGGIIVWEDERNGNKDIYAQRINSEGVSQWTPNGVVIRDTINDQMSHIIVSDNHGGGIIVWVDNRNGNWDIYAQHVDNDGNTGIMKINNTYAIENNILDVSNKNNTISIVYELAKQGNIQLNIYNISGQLIKTLYKGAKRKGTYKTEWNIRDSNGNTVPDGVYFCILKVENYEFAKKVLILE